MSDIMEDLMQINEAAEQLEGHGAIICDNGRFLSGTPYLWTSFADRAFRFKNAAQAQEIIDRYDLKARVILLD